MMNSGKLAGKTLFITGASRGIGKAIAVKAAKDGANVVIAAKTADPHPKLPGTIYTAAKEVEEAGGKALPCVVDVRDEGQVKSAVDNAVKKFGGIDILINNASAVSLSGTLNTDMKRYDLMNNINTRGTFLVSKTCLPHLKKSSNGHILNLSPPLNMHPFWFKNHVAYTIAKYGMSMCALGMAEEFKSDGVAVNALWPKTSNKNLFPDSFLDVNEYKTIFKKHSETKTVSQKRMMSTQAGDGGVDGIFATLKGKLNADIVNSTQAIFQFNLSAEGKEETYHIDLRNGDGSAGKGKPSDKPDATLTMNTENFQKLFAGKLKPTAAFMTGKLKISGNMQKAMKLEKLLSSLKSKA
ncbi:hydroxysteroid dehydrogenase-like protein 2 isoform X2 [Halyomorpha halys]|uniref:hydroxysteroid dehydrogenase-like protein 2 isoform X2 n=1 Tax=Halyomorpha halys TaxID=286706 RepID=UPI0006D4CBE6|nr:hydroxysteroid dehydrogenase-like protein 2 isoform X2 [Halyomorpha halys]